MRKDAGLRAKLTKSAIDKIADCHIHDLRHTFASLTARQGVPLQVVGGLLGHSDHKTTSRHLHLYDDSLRAGAAAISAIFKAG
ncbi:Tyrosine recombinase XerD (fragment) [Magnetospirillum sp. LM-5]|uniref:tyrosine-type recombinase/integrase n=1 Tax=Magnetospirillum sp. LM-5 TaxID=2681466 RepID=UPI0013857B9B